MLLYNIINSYYCIHNRYKLSDLNMSMFCLTSLSTGDLATLAVVNGVFEAFLSCDLEPGVSRPFTIESLFSAAFLLERGCTEFGVF